MNLIKIMLLAFLPVGNAAQIQLEVQGTINSRLPVAIFNVNYTGFNHVTGLISSSFPAGQDALYGYGGQFFGGYRGIYGRSWKGIGVYGESSDSVGVLGLSLNNFGIYGSSTNSIGVYGHSQNGYAGYFKGKVKVEESIVLGNTKEADPEPGTIRWNGSDFMGWNGAKWVSLTSGIAFDGEVEDIDGNKYRTIKVGNQEWMADNLRTSKYRNGDPIPNVTSYTNWSLMKSGAYCLYENDPDNEPFYGKLYNFYTISDERNICPTGWHIPTNEDWIALGDFLGGTGEAGGKMKDKGTAHWEWPNEGATNESGFTGLPGGMRRGNQENYNFWGKHIWGFWWSTKVINPQEIETAVLGTFVHTLQFWDHQKRDGLAIRCIKDP